MNTEPARDKKREDVDSTESSLPGLSGVLERFLRKFRVVAFLLLLLPIVPMYVLCLGAGFTAGMALYNFVSNSLIEFGVYSTAANGTALACAYLGFAFTLVFAVPLVNKLLPLRLKPFRGGWYSLGVIPWYYHNALVQLVRYTVLDILTPTPINILFYRLMGMKIGRNVVINTTNISDPALLTLEDNVIIGGSATLFAHYGMKGYLIIAPTIIRKNVNIGLKASVFGDVVIDAGVTVPPHAVILPKSRVSQEAQRLEQESDRNFSKSA